MENLGKLTGWGEKPMGKQKRSEIIRVRHTQMEIRVKKESVKDR